MLLRTGLTSLTSIYIEYWRNSSCTPSAGRAPRNISTVTEFYRDDFDITQLQPDLNILWTMFPNQLKSPSLSFHDVRKYMQSLSEVECALISEVVTLLKLILVLPSTNAASEQWFSAIRCLKTYLHATMKQEQLNRLLLLHVHKDHTENLSCINLVDTHCYVQSCSLASRSIRKLHLNTEHFSPWTFLSCSESTSTNDEIK